MSRMILSYSFIANNESLWTRDSDPGNIHGGEYGVMYTGDIVELLKDFYRLEYTYSTIKNNPFNGMERRKEAILDRLTSTFSEVTEEVKDIFLGVFSDWLRKHAITDPHVWAVARVEDAESMGSNEVYSSILNEWIRYHPRYSQGGVNANRAAENEFQKLIVKDDEIKSLLMDALGGKYDLVQDLVNSMMSDWEYSPEGIAQQLEIPEDSDEDAVREAVEQYAEEHAEEIFFESYEISDLFQRIQELGNATDLYVKIYEKYVFPAWFAHWQPLGIEDTRKTVEQAYQGLLNAEGLGNIFAAVNIAINTSHQNGSMLEYVDQATAPSESLKELLDSLTKGDFVEEVNVALRQVGVQV